MKRIPPLQTRLQKKVVSPLSNLQLLSRRSKTPVVMETLSSTVLLLQKLQQGPSTSLLHHRVTGEINLRVKGKEVAHQRAVEAVKDLLRDIG